MDLYIANYKYLHENGKIRSSQLAVYADNLQSARQKAAATLHNEVASKAYEIGNIRLWKPNATNKEEQKELPIENKKR